MPIKPWNDLTNPERHILLEQWIDEKTPLPGIAYLLETSPSEVRAFVKKRLPEKYNFFVAHCDLSMEVLRRRAAIAQYVYPPFNQMR